MMDDISWLFTSRCAAFPSEGEYEWLGFIKDPNYISETFILVDYTIIALIKFVQNIPCAWKMKGITWNP